MPRPPVAVRPRALGFSDLLLAVDVPAAVVTVAGTLDRSTAYHLSDAVSALRSSPSLIWTLDLAGLTFCDVEGLRVLQRARALAGDRGRVLHLRRPSWALADLLDLFDGVLRGDVPAEPVLVLADA